MNTVSQKFKLSSMALAVQAAMIAIASAAMPVYAEEMDEEVRELVMPTNTVEVGVVGVTGATDKSGEYTGLNQSGGKINGGFQLRGGDAYGMGSGTNRWSIEGRDLGTTSRSLDARFSEQGNWSLGFGQDQLRHYTTNGDFKTPFTGGMGGNVFRWTGTPLNAGSATSGPVFNGGAALTESSFHNESVYTDRKTNSFTAGYIYDRSLSFKFEAKRLEQTGAKLSSASSDMTLLSPLTAANDPALGNTNYFKGQGIVPLMSPTNYTTDTFDLGASWTGDKGHWNASYFASVFRDGYSGVSWDNPYYVSTALKSDGTTSMPPGTLTNTSYPATGMMMNSLGTAPSNDFHQINVSGGYKFSPTTRFAGGFSYGRNTQNQGYSGSYTASLLGMNGQSPVQTMASSSLNGLVYTKNANGRLTHQVDKNLEVGAGFRFNERDNQTSSGLYEYTNLAGAWRTSAVAAIPNLGAVIGTPTTTGITTKTVYATAAGNLVDPFAIGSASTNTENFLSIPMSNRRQLLDLSADYKLDSSRKVRATYENDRITRWCNVDPAANPTLVEDAGSATTISHNCAQVPSQSESRIGLTYRQNLGEGSSISLGYTNANRRSTVNPNYYNPGTEGSQATTTTSYANTGTTASPTVTKTVTTSPTGVVVPGFIAFFQASRKQDLLRATYNWQASENLDIGMRARYGSDDYYDSGFGVQSGRTVGLDFDVNYAYSSRHSLSAFFSSQEMRRDMKGDTSTNIVDTTTTMWGNTLKNTDRFVGIGTNQTGYFDGKWSFSQRLVYSLSTTNYSRTVLSGAAPASSNGSSGDAPEIRTESTQLRLGGVYSLSKEDRVLLNYGYMKLRSNDYYYNLYSSVSSIGTNTALPTFQDAPKYQVQMVSVMYSHSFR